MAEIEHMARLRPESIEHGTRGVANCFLRREERDGIEISLQRDASTSECPRRA